MFNGFFYLIIVTGLIEFDMFYFIFQELDNTVQLSNINTVAILHVVNLFKEMKI